MMGEEPFPGLKGRITTMLAPILVPMFESMEELDIEEI